MVNVFSSMLFGGISGSAVADISALGSILIPVMKDKGYDDDYAVNVTVTSSIAGILIPPSHNMILFAVAAGGGISISQLFLAGVVPGVLMCVCLAVAAYWLAVKRGYPAEPFPGWTALARHLHQRPARPVHRGDHRRRRPVRHLHGDRIGRVRRDLCALVTIIVYRSLTWESFKTAVVRAVRTTSMVMILIAFAQPSPTC